MSLKPLLSFSSGELDPVLTDNVTLEKFNKGLSTARNVLISKTGSIQSRFSRVHLKLAKNADEKIKVYSVPNTNYVLEFGPLYLRVYLLTSDDFRNTYTLTLQIELVTTYIEADLENLHFSTSKDYVYIFCDSYKVKKLDINDGSSFFVAEADIFAVPDILDPTVTVIEAFSTGYNVDYLVTLVINGEESVFAENVVGHKKPIAVATQNTISAKWLKTAVDINTISEVRVYSRPSAGGAYGFLGSTDYIVDSGLYKEAIFIDIGGLPDYANGVQDLITRYGLSGSEVIDLYSKTGAVYQQRLLLTVQSDKEALLASRPGFQNNFYRDFPYATDSALQFKAGTSGKAEVLRILDSDGLVVFTTNGIYTNSGLLGVNNLALDKKGSWIINELIPPLVVPGGVFFVDKNNTVRQFVFSQEILGYESVEQTIFSNHLFENRSITSWAFQDGLTPLIIVTFTDGTFATFTYNFEQQMRAWTRHDSSYPVEQVVGTTSNDRTFFVVNKDGQRSIEMSIHRKVPLDVVNLSPESDKSMNNTFMDSIVSTGLGFIWNDLLTASDDHFTITPVSGDDWSGPLNFTTTCAIDMSTRVIGDVFRVFNPVDKTYIDLTVTTTGATSLVVQPSEEFPEDLSITARIYFTQTVVTGLDHLEGELVSIIADGSLVSSPLNDQDVTTGYIVQGGEITLPERASIIHVGRPIVADVKTLNISTAEQSPTLIESLNVNKLYIRVKDTKGLYVSNKFPEESRGLKDQSSVIGMEDLFEIDVPMDDQDLIGNTYFKPISKRVEKTLPGYWGSQGQVSIRQVDPFPFEILSIIPDITVLTRSDR